MPYKTRITIAMLLRHDENVQDDNEIDVPMVYEKGEKWCCYCTKDGVILHAYSKDCPDVRYLEDRIKFLEDHDLCPKCTNHHPDVKCNRKQARGRCFYCKSVPERRPCSKNHHTSLCPFVTRIQRSPRITPCHNPHCGAETVMPRVNERRRYMDMAMGVDGDENEKPPIHCQFCGIIVG